MLPEVVLDTELNATAVAAGLRHTVAILSNGSVRSWGYNGKGQLGIGNLENVGDEPNEMGDNMAVTDLGDGVTPIAISAGGWHTCAIIDNYKLKCWGEREGEEASGFSPWRRFSSRAGVCMRWGLRFFFRPDLS